MYKLIHKLRLALQWVRVRVPIRYWAWIHAFLALGIGWGHAIALYPPTSYIGQVDLGLVLRMGLLTALGAITAVVGMLMTRSISQRQQHRGLWVELVGTILMGGGPLQYFGIQLAYVLEGEFDARYALVWFAYAMGAFVIVRFSIVIPALIEAAVIARTNQRGLR